MPVIFRSMHLMKSLTNALVTHALKPPWTLKFNLFAFHAWCKYFFWSFLNTPGLGIKSEEQNIQLLYHSVKSGTVCLLIILVNRF